MEASPQRIWVIIISNYVSDNDKRSHQLQNGCGAQKDNSAAAYEQLQRCLLNRRSTRRGRTSPSWLSLTRLSRNHLLSLHAITHFYGEGYQSLWTVYTRFFSEYHRFSRNRLTHFYWKCTPSLSTVQDYQQDLTPDCYHTLYSGPYLQFLLHHCPAKYVVEFEDLLHAEKESMKDNGVFVIITISNTISRFTSGQASPKIGSGSLYSTETTVSHYARHYPGYTRLEYLTGRLVSAKSPNKTACLRVGHFWKLQYIYIYI